MQFINIDHDGDYENTREQEAWEARKSMVRLSSRDTVRFGDVKHCVGLNDMPANLQEDNT